MGLLLTLIVILVLLSVVPAWPHSRTWGYGPSGVLGAVLLIILILMLIGVLTPLGWGPATPAAPVVP